VLSLKQRTRSDFSVKRVGLISDTHIPTRAKEIPAKVFDLLKDVDFIIHAGDLVELKVIDKLEQLAPVLAVYGNMDRTEIRKVLPEMNELKLLDWKIGVTHDPGVFFGGTKMREIAEKNNYNVLVYGHTHRPSINWEDRRLYINPGSPTNPLPPFITKPAIAIMKLTKEKVEPEIIPL
jgi:putative phosphoesterase